VAMEITQIPGGSGVPAAPTQNASVIPVSLGGASLSGVGPHAIVSASDTALMPEMSASDIDRLLGLDDGSAHIY